MRSFLGCVSLCLVLTGCTTVSELESVKRGEGKHVLFDVATEKLEELAQRAFEDCGLVVKRVYHKPERVEILAYEPAQLGESGSVYGLYLYALSSSETEAYLLRKNRYPTKVFARDATEEILARLDELILEKP